MTKLPRLELTEDPNNRNDFIIFRNQNYTYKAISKKTNKKRKNKTKKHYRKKYSFNIF